MRVLNVLRNENGDSQLIVTLILIAVAIGLCIIFRNAMANVLDGAIKFIKDAIAALFSAGGDSTSDVTVSYTYGG